MRPTLVIREIEDAQREILDALGVGRVEPAYLDLANTPARVAKMMVNELMSSYHPGAIEGLVRAMTTFPSEGKHEMVVVGPIPFTSLCAHHMIPFMGDAYVGYIPDRKIVGLSKVARVVEFFSRKLQIQERMTSEVADFLKDQLAPKGVGVRLWARHLCMEARGVRKAGVGTTTTALRGGFTGANVKSEFFQTIADSRR